MKIQKYSRIPMVALAFLVFAGACNEGDDDEIGDYLAQVSTDDDLTITFVEMNDGGIAVSEQGSTDTPSILAYFAAEHATPLEVFLSVAPDEMVPTELEAHHSTVTDVAPRSLLLPNSEFRSFSGSVAAADCSTTADASWYNSLMTSTGWMDSDYFSGSMGYLHGLGDKTATHLIAHLCNYSESGGSGSMFLSVGHSGSDQYTLNGIDPGERAVIYVLSDTHSWGSYARGPGYPQTNMVRHGLLAP